MALVRPFRGTYYHLGKTDVSELIIPPYDAIPAADEKKYLDRSPYNFSHVDLQKKPEDDYQESKSLIGKWIEKGIWKETEKADFYLYSQKFQARGKSYVRNTLLCTVGLVDFSQGVVRPHENTFGKYKADRLQLLKTTNYNLSHIFGMVKDEEGYLNTQFEKWAFEKPFLSAKSDDGVDHSIWKIEESHAKGIAEFFEDKPIYIVDGHHRYESALMNAREKGVEGKFEHPAAHTTFCIANTFDPGLVVFLTHRILKKGFLPELKRATLEHDYDLSPMTFVALKTFVVGPDDSPRFALYWQGNLYSVLPKNWRAEEAKLGKSVAKLAVAWSDHKFLKNLCGVTDENRGQRIRYEKDLDFTWTLRNEADLIVFHAPPAVTDVTAVADEKKFMPQKSTFFIPKLAGGLISRRLG